MDQRRDTLFSYVRPDSRVPQNHPLRPIRRITDTALRSLSDRFDSLYSEIGRPSIPPERLLRALLLRAFFSIRLGRQLMEQFDYNLLFRWFVGLSVDEPVWAPSVYSKNRDRMLAGDIAAAFMDAVLNQDEVKGLLSAEHFSDDGTQIQAWASMKSFRRKDGQDEPPSRGRNGEWNFHNYKRRNETHASTTDWMPNLTPGVNASTCGRNHPDYTRRRQPLVATRRNGRIPMTNCLDYAKIAFAAYFTGTSQYYEDPSGHMVDDWVVQHWETGTLFGDGFQGGIWQSKTDVVVGCCGTNPKQKGTLVSGLGADAKIGLRILPNQCSSARQMVVRAKEIAGNRRVSVTGHSLGGGLSQVIGVWDP